MITQNTSLQVSLIGAPTDVGAGTRGGSMGPEALRVAGIASALSAFGVDVRDCGDLVGPPNPCLPAVNGLRHLPEVITWNTLLHDAVYAELCAGRLPIMLGGDHCLAIGSISAVARHCREQGRKLRVLWFDAHADLNTATLTPSGNIHGMPGPACAAMARENSTKSAAMYRRLTRSTSARSAFAASTKVKNNSFASSGSKSSICAMSTSTACAP